MSFSIRALPLLGLPLVAACGGDKTEPSDTHSGTTTPTTDSPYHTGTTVTDSELPHSGTTTTTVTETGLPPGLHGTPPAVAKAVPSFTQVTNRQNQGVSSADLVGHPTVVWFYPAANTGG